MYFTVIIEIDTLKSRKKKLHHASNSNFDLYSNRRHFGRYSASYRFAFVTNPNKAVSVIIATEKGQEGRAGRMFEGGDY